jgi:hypothetical protein
MRCKSLRYENEDTALSGRYLKVINFPSAGFIVRFPLYSKGMTSHEIGLKRVTSSRCTKVPSSNLVYETTERFSSKWRHDVVTGRTILSSRKCFEVFTEGDYSDCNLLCWDTYRKTRFRRNKLIFKVQLPVGRTRRRGRRHTQLLDDLKEARRYWKLKEEAQDRTL